jgi:hypothetical protein
MPNQPATEADAAFLEVTQSGYELLADPLLNKGTAFSEIERDEFDLNGLLPPNIGTLEEQVSRRLQVLRGFASDLERYAFLRELQDTNETLFFALLVQNLEHSEAIYGFIRLWPSRDVAFEECRVRCAGPLRSKWHVARALPAGASHNRRDRKWTCGKGRVACR